MGMKFIKDRDLGNPTTATHRHYLSWIRPYIQKKKVLDIGCWVGSIETLLSKENCDVTAIDIEGDPLKVARKRFPRMRFVQSSIVEGTPFKKNKFDVVLFFMVIEHIPHGSELTAMININKIMKKKGNLFLTTMNSHPISNLFDPAYFLTGHRHYSKKHLTELLELAGFEVKDVRYNGGFSMILYTWLLYISKHILRRPEPKGGLMDKLMAMGYNNKGFNEINIQAVKMREIKD
jgi:ubiquinone/menaquinone biosynthesis C-methylase UbiE